MKYSNTREYKVSKLFKRLRTKGYIPEELDGKCILKTRYGYVSSYLDQKDYTDIKKLFSEVITESKRYVTSGATESSMSYNLTMTYEI